MKKLHLTCHSALRLTQWRLACLEARVAALNSRLEERDRWRQESAPAKSYTRWILAGLIALGILAIVAFSNLSKGGTRAMNIPYLLTAIVATIAISLHCYTFEVWIWPKLKDEGFPPTPFGGPEITKGLYRTVWHFFTWSLLGTIVMMLFFTFGDVVPYANLVVLLLMIYWTGIIIVIFVVGALNLTPGVSYIKTMIKAFQWTLPLAMVLLMYWGIQQ